MAHTLHIFNPDTDYALGCSSPIYTPPAIVARFRDQYALLPAIYASPGDFILIFSDLGNISRKFHDLAEAKEIRLSYLNDLESLSHIDDISTINPWGWNPTLVRQLKEYSKGILSHLLPSSDDINKLRRLAHRNTTVRFHDFYKSEGFNDCKSPEECLTLQDAMLFKSRNGECFYKAPHSSSGRGVMQTEGLNDTQISQWISGIISSQGSVMAEADMHKALDFASEWKCEKGIATFMGWAVFEASRRGKYHYNVISTQTRLRSIIADHISIDPESIIEMQKKAIENIVGENYSGPLGIDMVASEDGKVNPCIEINFRNTMGSVAISVIESIENSNSRESIILNRYFPSGRLTL